MNIFFIVSHRTLTWCCSLISKSDTRQPWSVRLCIYIYIYVGFYIGITGSNWAKDDGFVKFLPYDCVGNIPWNFTIPQLHSLVFRLTIIIAVGSALCLEHTYTHTNITHRKQAMTHTSSKGTSLSRNVTKIKATQFMLCGASCVVPPRNGWVVVLQTDECRQQQQQQRKSRLKGYS